ncbi:hypothetical protein J2W88_001896 [Acidovorax delafieldii]|uniref:Ig-like protein group 2 n=1 Tax=Acidovorax delafieldii TaxID=47920 RepID=A0AAJ2C6G1_ACIDE|nr:hypothetical protein [Acidovorax delafieldii]MDR6766631.1 hypothetical protein [Acidovorax delafieldii]MDR6836431.1 hypothetical protein [Acidovorax delafieldii]MDR7365922.1 hypothetical protein [Acidovorax delafieldii]
MKNIFKALLAMTLSLLLVACGGGGGGGGTPNGPSATLRVYPPVGAITLPVGASGSTGIEVRGGKAPYGVISSDASVSAFLSDDSILFISGNSDGTSTLTVYDESLPVQQVKITVTAKAVPLASSAGTAVTLRPNQSLQFNVRGGVGPYSVNSSDTSVVSASISGSTVTLQGLPKAGASTILITDSVGATLSVTATVQVSTIAVSPASITGPAGTNNTVTINGGVAPYAVSSTNTAVATASISGATVSVALVSLGSADIKITDAAGTSIVVSVTVNSNVLQVSPANQTVDEKSPTSTTLTYLIAGGTAPYTPLVSPADKAYFTTLSVTANTLTATLPDSTTGPRCVTADKVIPIDVYDSKLVKQTVSVTIKDGGAVACP